MRTKTIAAGLGAAGILGVGLYLAVPASAADPSPSPSASPTQYRDHPGHPGKGHPFLRARALRGVHGEATVKRKDGFHLATWQRGKITSVSSTGLTVRSDDGASWTWTANGDTRVRKDGGQAALKDLANGEQVLVAGERSGETRTARLVRVPKNR
ncbi:DUF5666 domain-containing protein [Actinomadura latina]|uniref:DUF5666 domain-containing protein n=1 Tax=Actinomadura latina TaxID=163603 RepID=A0A846Z6I8_9ACTN|nr:DUF5666 domain-containing protein [Actinomadura latina]NKZ07911.1 hypothetical protein [Actinomadura latina]